MLFDFAISDNMVKASSSHTKIRTCLADASLSDSLSEATCLNNYDSTEEVSVVPQIVHDGPTSSSSISDVVFAIEQLDTYMAQQEKCNSTIVFASSGSAKIGVYAGSEIQRQNLTANLLNQITSVLQDGPLSETTLLQLCAQNQSSRYTFGVFINTAGDLLATQNAVQTWHNGTCSNLYSDVSTGDKVTYTVPVTQQPTSNATSTDSLKARQIPRMLQPRTTCSTIQVASGDTCDTLAAECGVSTADFTKYNPSTTLCSTLVPGARVLLFRGTPGPHS
jgi:chitinase